MTETIENFMLEHLKRFQSTLESVQRDVREVKTRQSETHAAVLAFWRDRDRLDRVERRLDLAN